MTDEARLAELEARREETLAALRAKAAASRQHARNREKLAALAEDKIRSAREGQERG